MSSPSLDTALKTPSAVAGEAHVPSRIVASTRCSDEKFMSVDATG